MDQNSLVVASRGLDRICCGSFGRMLTDHVPETTAQQDENSSSEGSVVDTTLATRSTLKSTPERSSEPSHPPVKLAPRPVMGKIRSSVQDQRILVLPPNFAGRDCVLQQTLECPNPKGIPVEAVPVRMSVKSMPHRQANSAKSPSQNVHGDTSFVWNTY